MGEIAMALMLFSVMPDCDVKIVADDDRTAYHEAKGGFERETMAWWTWAVVPGKIAVDVGAYTGIYSIVASRLGAAVVAIEPLHENADRLETNIRINRASGITVIRAAASDHEGRGVLRYNGRINLTSGGTIEAGSDAIRSHTAHVTTLEIDALALSSVGVIKIDVEGHERNVLAGAKKILERDKPVLFIETLTEDARQAVADMLPGFGMAALLDGRNAVFVPR